MIRIATLRLPLLAAGALALCATGAASAGVVVIANPDAADMSQNQIADVYMGKDSSYRPLDLPESAGVREDFYQKATGRSLAQIKATWARLAFSGRAQPPKELADAAAVKAAVAADPRAIGYIDSSSVDGTVKVVLSLD